MTLYLACLILGGIFIAVTLLFGSDGDAGFDVDSDVDLGGDAGAEVSSHFDVDAHGEGVTAAIKFLSFRNLVFFTAFFGLTGTVLTWLSSPFIITLLAAAGMGFFAAALMHKTMSHLVRSEVGEAMNIENVIGLPAKVILNLSKHQKGKISLNANGQFFQLRALTAEEANRDEFKAGESVVIIKVQDGLAYVAEEEFV
jgi:membrane protein implicated in regulation of membrane protease activity